MTTSQAFIDRDLRRCHDLLNMANLFVAQKKFSSARSAIGALRANLDLLAPKDAQFFRDRLIALDVEHSQKIGKFLSDDKIVDLSLYRRQALDRRLSTASLASAKRVVAGQRRHTPAVAEDDRGNFIYRMPMPVDEVSTSDSLGMESLLQIWRQAQQATGRRHGLPLLSDLDPKFIADIGMLGFVHVIDASSDDPGRFHVTMHGSRVTPFNGRNFSGRALHDFPIPIYRESVATDYNTVRMTGVPAYHRVIATVDGSRRHYTRLLLPFSTDGNRPDRLLVGVRTDNWLPE
ncbi:MAG: PAS domain-containing protein [Oceanibaculum nanhaiense]|uniref:PAS domain-containing protein n=1 Tax=Oceanibaculum nanhaiense TaxID=1909734 RepID=UPI0025A3D002|nr:PAS domain-containing protein [Oceanibaculum nanhaiense]MDM7947956.1 PAS domain-containing protein [Oceanibaculum nanhaiense]